MDKQPVPLIGKTRIALAVQLGRRAKIVNHICLLKCLIPAEEIQFNVSQNG
jgi:hypothetical protein